MSARKPIPSAVTLTPPEGWEEVALFDPFEAHVGPLFRKVEADGSKVFAFIADQRHLNEDGVVHEGMMMTFADAFLGNTAHYGAGEKSCVTVSLQASFPGVARLGDFIECRTRLERKTRSIVFVSARFSVNGTDIMTVSSLWKVLGER